MEPKQQIELKAFIVLNNKVFIIRENNKSSFDAIFDVPGSILGAGEKIAESLSHSVNQKTGLDVRVGQPFYIDEITFSEKGKQVQNVTVFVMCTLSGREPEVQLSSEYDYFQWINPENYISYQLSPFLKKAFHYYNKTVR